MAEVIPVCFWCREPFPEAAVPREAWAAANGPDAAVPERLVVSYVPCPRCREKIGPRRILVAEISNRQPTDGRPAINGDDEPKFYPTGLSLAVEKAVFADFARSLGIPEEAWRRMVEQESMAALTKPLLEKLEATAEPSNKDTRKKPKAE